jgi:cytochrome c-type protein NapB
MKLQSSFLIAAALLVILAGVACSGGGSESGPVEDSSLGLEQTSVTDTPDPIVASFTAGEPGENETEEAYFSESPPIIPHQVEEFLPIRIDDNQCLDCHDAQDAIGTELEAGDPTPMPVSHYTDLRNDPGTVTNKVMGARFTCVQCHAPQADAPPLVANTYQQ